MPILIVQTMENYLKPRRFLFLWIFAVILNIITFFLIYFKAGLQDDNVALRYTIKAGVLWYGKGANLYTLPFFGLLANAINFSLYKKLSEREKFLKHAITLTSLLVQVLLLLGIILLTTIN